MADNFTANAGSGGDTFAADDIGSVKYPRGKISIGADGAAADCAATNPLPIGGNTVKDGSGTVYALLLDSDGHQQCDIVGALPTGANVIGGVTQSGTWNVGTVTAVTTVTTVTTVSTVTNVSSVNAVIPGTGATNLGKAIDTAAGGTDTGVASLAVRDDALAALTPAEGDYVPLRTDANGALWMIHSGALPITDNSGSITVDGSVNISGSVTPGTGATNLGKAEDAAHASGNVGVMALAVRNDTPAALADTDGDYIPLTTDSSGRLHVTVGNTVTVGSHAVTNAGTFVVQENGAALTSLQLIDDTVFVDDAAFTPGTSKVSAIGFQADETATDSVDEGDIGAARMTLDRKVHVAAELESNAIRAGGTACTPKYAVIDAATSGDNTLVAAVNPKKIRVLSLFLMAAGTVNVRFESGASGTALTGQMNLVANNGFVLPFNPAGWFETASNTLLNLELSGAISVDGSLTYIEV